MRVILVFTNKIHHNLYLPMLEQAPKPNQTLRELYLDSICQNKVLESKPMENRWNIFMRGSPPSPAIGGLDLLGNLRYISLAISGLKIHFELF